MQQKSELTEVRELTETEMEAVSGGIFNGGNGTQTNSGTFSGTFANQNSGSNTNSGTFNGGSGTG